MRRHEHDLLVEEQRRIDREPRMRNQRVLRSDADYSARLAGEMQESMAFEKRVRFFDISFIAQTVHRGLSRHSARLTLSARMLR
jgi:hypothetical protein